jgi:glycosyltransferase involved in cell wall biosynthesis
VPRANIPAPAGPDPFFSVIVPTRGREVFLGEALSSALDQTFQEFEIIVVDDGPSAEAERVVASFGDDRVRYLRNDRPRGGAGTRNAGASRARGEWLAFLDDDDIWLPTKLERQHELAVAAPAELALIYTGHVRFEPAAKAPEREFRPDKRGRIHQELLYRNFISGLSSVAIRKRVFDELTGFDERFPALQDIELYVRLARSYAVDFVDEPLVRVRRGPEERISTNAVKKLEANMLFWRKYEVDLRRRPKLAHRAASRVLVYAYAANDLPALAISLPWTLAGLLVDPGNAGQVARELFAITMSKLQPDGGPAGRAAKSGRPGPRYQ